MNDALAWIQVAEAAEKIAADAMSKGSKTDVISALFISNEAWKKAFLVSRQESKAPDATTPDNIERGAQ